MQGLVHRTTRRTARESVGKFPSSYLGTGSTVFICWSQTRRRHTASKTSQSYEDGCRGARILGLNAPHSSGPTSLSVPRAQICCLQILYEEVRTIPSGCAVPHGSAWTDRTGANGLLRPCSCNLYNKVILEGGDDHQGTEAQAIQ